MRKDKAIISSCSPRYSKKIAIYFEQSISGTILLKPFMIQQRSVHMSWESLLFFLFYIINFKMYMTHFYRTKKKPQMKNDCFHSILFQFLCHLFSEILYILILYHFPFNQKFVVIIETIPLRTLRKCNKFLF